MYINVNYYTYSKGLNDKSLIHTLIRVYIVYIFFKFKFEYKKIIDEKKYILIGIMRRFLKRL